VAEVRVNKVFHLDVEGETDNEIRAKVEEICNQLLANPVLEDFTIELVP
jgi:phosphoribosylformylglycinamidine synthase PurS subunit